MLQIGGFNLRALRLLNDLLNKNTKRDLLDKKNIAE